MTSSCGVLSMYKEVAEFFFFLKKKLFSWMIHTWRCFLLQLLVGQLMTVPSTMGMVLVLSG